MSPDALIGAGPVLLDLEPDGLARLRLNRPDAANGMNVELLQALHEGIMRCHREPRVRAVLLTGEGANFCAGGDVKAFAAQGESLPEYLREATALLNLVAEGLIGLEVPVVTAVHGFAAGGGGLGLVCASDIVIAARSARFMSAATRAGMAPDAGTSVTLSRIVGHRRALELVLTDKVLDAAEALAVGLVTRVVPDADLLDEATELGRELAARATRALGATKRLLWSGLGRGIEDALPDEARTVAKLGATEDVQEGLAAVIEKRPPRFQGR